MKHCTVLLVLESRCTSIIELIFRRWSFWCSTMLYSRGLCLERYMELHSWRTHVVSISILEASSPGAQSYEGGRMLETRREDYLYVLLPLKNRGSEARIGRVHDEVRRILRGRVIRKASTRI